MKKEHRTAELESVVSEGTQASAEFAIFLLEPGGKVLSWNEGAERFTGYKAIEIIGKHFTTFFSTDNIRKNKSAAVLTAAATDGRVEYADWHVKKDGSHFWASLLLTSMYAQDGNLFTYSLEMRLASPTNQLAEKLRSRNVELEEQLAMGGVELNRRTAQLDERTAQLDERTAELGERTGQLGVRTAQLGERTGQLDERTAQLGERTGQLGVRTAQLGERTGQLGDRTAQLDERTAELGERTGQLGVRTAQLGERTGQLHERTAQLGERTGQLGVRTAQLGERTGQLGDRTAQLDDRTAQLDERTAELGERTGQLGVRTAQLGERTGQLGDRTAQLDERTAQLGERTGQLGVRTAQLGERTGQLGDRTTQLTVKTKDFDRAEALNKELEAFTYAASHDLRAPLRSIDGFSLALLEDHSAQLNLEGQDHLNRIRTCAQRMGQLIDDLIGLSSLTRASLKRRPVDLVMESKKIAAELQSTDPNRTVTFKFAEKLSADCDVGLIRIVLQNLLGNAYKYTSKRQVATIEVGGTKTDEGTVYFVRDNGAGFDMKYVHKLFGPFQRLHSSTEFAGNGIGLATVQRIINRHGGQVWAEGEVDKGTTIFFTL